MQRFFVLALLSLFILAACGGIPENVTVPEPPQSRAYEEGQNPELDQIIESWRQTVPQEMERGSANIQLPNIEEQVFESDASLEEIANFYSAQLTQGDPAWVRIDAMPGIQNGILLEGYEIANGAVSLVVGAIDAGELGLGDDVRVVYTVLGQAE